MKSVILVLVLLFWVQFWVYSDAQHSFYYWVDKQCPPELSHLGHWCPVMGGEIRPDMEGHHNTANYEASLFRVRTKVIGGDYQLNEVLKVPKNVWRVRVFYNKVEYDE